MKDSFRRGGNSVGSSISMIGNQTEEFKSPPAIMTPASNTGNNLRSNPMVSFCEKIEEMHETESVMDKQSPKAKLIIGHSL